MVAQGAGAFTFGAASGAGAFVPVFGAVLLGCKANTLILTDAVSGTCRCSDFSSAVSGPVTGAEIFRV